MEVDSVAVDTAVERHRGMLLPVDVTFFDAEVMRRNIFLVLVKWRIRLLTGRREWRVEMLALAG